VRTPSYPARVIDGGREMVMRKVRGKEIIDYDGTVVFLPNASAQLLGPDGHPFTGPDFRSRARKTPAIMFECDDGGNIWHNAFTAQFTNIPRESLLGMDFLRMVHPEDRFSYLARTISPRLRSADRCARMCACCAGTVARD
jgi:hypothetical protein